MQKINIVGNLFADAELKTSTKDGESREFITFRVAVNQRYRDADETTTYEVAMRKTGIYDYLKKGQKVAVSGDLRMYTTEKEGKQYVHLAVLNPDVELCGGKKD